MPDTKEIELTPEEIKNGWTPETLKEYLEERERETAKSILFKPKDLPRIQNSQYSPHRWRR